MSGTLLGNTIAGIGSSLNLPEFGISEFLGGYQAQPIGPETIGNYPGAQLSPVVGGGTIQGPVRPSNWNPSGAGTIPSPSPTGGTGGQVPAPNLDSLYTDTFSALDSQLAGLDSQRAGQERVAGNTYQQGYNTLSNQYKQNSGDIDTSQKRSLNDLGSTIRQLFQSGNTLLGTRGASDSSAANQYSYALTKMGSQQRGDIMGELDRRRSNLKQTYDTNLQNLELQKNNQLQQIAQWYADSQNSIRGIRADLQRQKSQEALNYAISIANQINQNTANQRNALDTWVMNHAKTLQEAQAGMAQNAQNLPAFQGLNAPITGGTTGGYNMFGFGSNDQDKNRLF